MLTINIPSSSGDCVQINPVPQIYTQIPLGDPTQGYVNTGVRYFWGSAPPANPNVMDQWYTPDTHTLSEWVTDGVDYFWSVIMSAGLVEEAPIANTIFSRYNGVWVADPIQSDALNDGSNYTRIRGSWMLSAIQTDAPITGKQYARVNGGWAVVAPPFTDAPSDGSLYGRTNGSWGQAYPMGNPAGYQTVADVNATLDDFLPLEGGEIDGDLRITGNLNVAGLSFFTGNVVAYGSVALANDPISGMQAATKRYVDSQHGLPGPAGPQGAPGPAGPTGPQGPPGTTASVTISASAPASPTVGTLWFDSSVAQMYIWFDDGTSQQWVPAVNQAGASGGGSAPPGPPSPATLPLPDVTPHGGAISGQTLSCSQGFWSNIPTSYAYQWRRGGTNISGATAATYTLVDADAALSVDCVVTATNSVGSNSASSNAIAVAPLNPYPATNLKALFSTRQLGQ